MEIVGGETFSQAARDLIVIITRHSFRDPLFFCPDSPNCVSTQSTAERHAIAALPFHGSAADTVAVIVDVVRRMDRTTIITIREDYIHVEYRTRLGFVDDVEFVLEEDSRTVQFRSASRVGYWDLGVNRRRMERFSALYGDLP